MPKKKKKKELSHLWYIQTVDVYEVVKDNEVDLYGLTWKTVPGSLLTPGK